MIIQTQISMTCFEAAIRQHIEEHNSVTGNSRAQYQLVYVDADTYVIRIWKGPFRNVYATLKVSEGDSGVVVNAVCQSAEAQSVGDLEVRAGVAATIATWLTVFVLGTVLMWGAAWGIMYLIGSRNPFLPLAVPALIYACRGVTFLVRRLRVNRRFLAFMTDFTGVVPNTKLDS